MNSRGLERISYLWARRRKALIIWGGSLIAFCLYLVVLFLAIKEMETTRERVITVKSEIKSIQLQSSQLDNKTSDLEQASQKLTGLEEKFGTNVQDGLFLVHFDRKLKEEETLLTACRALELEQHSNFFALPLEITLQGSYTRILTLLEFLENQNNLTELRDIYITSRPEQQRVPSNQTMPTNSKELPDGHVEARITLVMYAEPSAAGRLRLQDMENWFFGRINPFEKGH